MLLGSCLVVSSLTSWSVVRRMLSGETNGADDPAQRPCTKAVILARGLGTRMRRDDDTPLDPSQASMAASGSKAMIPVGMPFLDYVLSGLADAGFTDVCIVIAPGPSEIRDRYARDVIPTRLAATFAVQERPIGTADAVLAAQSFTAGEPFVVLNADNYYPIDVLSQLRNAGGPAGVAFSRAGLVRSGDIAPERIAAYAILDIDDQSILERIVEKPDAASASAATNAAVSMNCWRFDSEIFKACREVQPSSRGELELPLAIQYAIDVLGMRFYMIGADASVLDLSRRADIPGVKARLQSVAVRL